VGRKRGLMQVACLAKRHQQGHWARLELPVMALKHGKAAVTLVQAQNPARPACLIMRAALNILSCITVLMRRRWAVWRTGRQAH